jgi:hypothetical protein
VHLSTVLSVPEVANDLSSRGIRVRTDWMQGKHTRKALDESVVDYCDKIIHGLTMWRDEIIIARMINIAANEPAQPKWLIFLKAVGAELIDEEDETRWRGLTKAELNRRLDNGRSWNELTNHLTKL